jgi:hemolysin III
MIKPKEPVSFYTHALGAIMSVAGTVFLIMRSYADTPKFITLIIYGSSMTLLFTASSLYHAFKTGENDESIFRKLDHLAIFFMIAGTYTPPCYHYLEGGWRIGIIGAQWALVVFGVFFKFFYVSGPRFLSTAVYVLMGWLAVIPMHKFVKSMPGPMIVLMIAGGVAFTMGAAIYAIKKPDPLPGRFGFHEIFHIFILAGAGIQYAGMLYIVK